MSHDHCFSEDHKMPYSFTPCKHPFRALRRRDGWCLPRLLLQLKHLPTIPQTMPFGTRTPPTVHSQPRRNPYLISRCFPSRYSCWGSSLASPVPAKRLLPSSNRSIRQGLPVACQPCMGEPAERCPLCHSILWLLHSTRGGGGGGGDKRSGTPSRGPLV